LTSALLITNLLTNKDSYDLTQKSQLIY